jgi:hypothetical protein
MVSDLAFSMQRGGLRKKVAWKPLTLASSSVRPRWGYGDAVEMRQRGVTAARENLQMYPVVDGLPDNHQLPSSSDQSLATNSQSKYDYQTIQNASSKLKEVLPNRLLINNDSTLEEFSKERGLSLPALRKTITLLQKLNIVEDKDGLYVFIEENKRPEVNKTQFLALREAAEIIREYLNSPFYSSQQRSDLLYAVAAADRSIPEDVAQRAINLLISSGVVSIQANGSTALAQRPNIRLPLSPEERTILVSEAEKQYKISSLVASSPSAYTHHSIECAELICGYLAKQRNGDLNGDRSELIQSIAVTNSSLSATIANETIGILFASKLLQAPENNVNGIMLSRTTYQRYRNQITSQLSADEETQPTIVDDESGEDYSGLPPLTWNEINFFLQFRVLFQTQPLVY